MEKIVQTTETITKITHEFYCDKCDTYIDKYTELDGEYKCIGDFELNFLMPDGWYNYHKCLCNTCKETVLSEISTALEALGFTLNG